MKHLKFLGTGTSQGVPVIGCGCPVCRSTDPRNRRSRTSALLRTPGQTILFDAGPDFRTQALEARIEHLDAVLLTHAHFDHVGGLDDLRPLTERQGAMPLYGYSSTLQEVRRFFNYAFVESSSSSESTRPRLELIPVSGPFRIGEVEVVPFDIRHGSWTITGYRIGKFAYVTDASAIPPASLEHLQGLEVLVLNALRYTFHPTHFSLDNALTVIDQLGPRRAFLVHLSHAFDHAEVSARLPAGVALAYDGLEVAIEE
jgi:phosphoribosyl 1,2-cyclic phosphate phosphodiesterase